MLGQFNHQNIPNRKPGSLGRKILGSGGLINDQNNIHNRGSQNARGTGGFGTLSPQANY